MKNMRIVSDNAIDRSVLTASSEASTSMGVANLKIDKKSNVWRSSNGTTARLNASWSSAVDIACVALPFCNFSPTATMRVRVTNEPSVTNLFTFSEQLDNAAWLKTRCTVTADSTVAPDGTSSAELLQGDGTGLTYAYQQKTLAANAAYPVSCFVKAGTYTGAFQIHDFTDGGTVQVNLATLDITASGNFSSPKLSALPNGWYRLSAIITPVTTGAKNISLFNATTTGNVYIWGAMLQTGSGSLTSYYPSLATAGVRPIGYIDSWQSYAYDSGAVLCCPEPAAQPRGWTAAQAASAYAYGGGAFARHWIATTLPASYGLAVDIVDVNNVQGYIEAARLVAGPYWSTTYNPSAVSFGIVDTTNISRSDAGDQLCEVGNVHRTLTISLSMMPAQDRAPFVNLLKNSRSYPILVSVLPEIEEEGDTIIYGRRTKDSDISIQYAFVYNSNLSLESI